MKKIPFNDKYGLTEAVLSGRKTQTRRICNIRLTNLETGEETFPSDIAFLGGEWRYTVPEWGNLYQPLPKANHPRYEVGEIVAVAQRYSDFGAYCLDSRPMTDKRFVKAEYMPHHIRITNVRVERLQDISDEDCIKEGVVEVYVNNNWGNSASHWKYNVPYEDSHGQTKLLRGLTPQETYAVLIDRISGNGTWESNPWCFVYDFELIK